jgi:hypothetical protein
MLVFLPDKSFVESAVGKMTKEWVDSRLVREDREID